MSDKIEVDPKLFITCRLCLEDMGQYQIVPKVREQIKFCFDIEVEPFDGLPQLICKKCEGILSGFYETKTVYIKKQKDLKYQFSLKKGILVSQKETTESRHQNGFEKKSLLFGKSRRRNNVLRISSSSSEFSHENNDSREFSHENNDSREFSHENNNESDITSWTLLYNKQFACRFCNYLIDDQSYILSHVHTCHKQVKKNHRNVFKKECFVQLPKFQSEPNITGLSSTVVVLGDGKIIEHVNMDYYIVYSIKKDNYNVCKNSENEDAEMFMKKKRKRIRLFSKSSNETVVVHPDENDELSVDKPEIKRQKKADSEVESSIYECIKIDDSSSSDSDRENVSVKKMSYVKLLQKHQETIQSIISVCKNNVFKNIDESSAQIKHKNKCPSANMESQLKHKLLSIGRKIVNKQGFNCTGLLRYMEYKHLDIAWIPKATVNPRINTDYIRIMTKLKDNMEEDDTSCKSFPANEVVPKNKIFCIDTSSSAVTITKLGAETNNESISGQNILYNDIGYSSNQSKNKLLNKSPVANPKQLPRKTHITETKLNNHSKMLTVPQNSSHNEQTVCVEITEDNSNENTFMPIMTEVTSLASNNNENSNNNETTDTNTTNVNTDTPIGRIKVKPVSELMSERVLNNMKEQTPASNINNFQYVALTYLTNTIRESPDMPIQIVQVPNTSKSNVLKSNKQLNNANYVILDTVELPNTRTDAPFKYLQNLLQIHNIILLDTKDTLGTNFKCLIKFKVQYKQEYKDQPVILCLSLFCNNNTFCIKVTDRNQESIDTEKISANWQCEIIKIFTGETVNKLLQNAEKISKEVYEYTKNFSCLLKSIKVTKIV